MLPRDVSLLARVFPGAPEVDGELAAAGDGTRELPDPQELRLRVFGELRELLVRLGREATSCS